MTTEDRSFLERIIRLAIAHRWLVLLLTMGAAVLGAWSYARLPIDATPDITNVQVQINTQAPGYSPLEAEQRITFPVRMPWRAFRSWTTPAHSPGMGFRR